MRHRRRLPSPGTPTIATPQSERSWAWPALSPLSDRVEAPPQLGFRRSPEQLCDGELERLGAAVGAVVGGHEVMPDGQREREYGTGFDLPLIGTERSEQRAEVFHALVVDPPQTLLDGG